MMIKIVSRVKKLSIGVALSILVSGSIFAQTKVVVIPLAGQDVEEVRQPSFRIVPTTINEEAATSGRLEFTSDDNPSPKSDWGKVCDDCFAGANNCAATPTPITDAASVAVCKDLGYETGISVPNLGSTGMLDFSLDDVVCPEGASSFDDCTSAPFNTHNCSVGEEVYIQCLISVPEIVYPGFTWSCEGLTGNLPSFPDQFNDLDDSDLANPVIIAAPFGDGEFRESFFENGNSFTFILRDVTPSESYNYESHRFDFCPEPLRVDSDTWEFDITSTQGRTWVVTGGYNATSTLFTFEDLIFRLKQ
ncbi:scavenger receptor cysteine-rich domain-containing protein [Arenicella sp.]|nr:scavenger receptor cysteine-rich domain-containing protein [Arenicella sp.]